MKLHTLLVGLGAILTAFAVACSSGSTGTLSGNGTQPDTTGVPGATGDVSAGAQSVKTRKCVNCHTSAMSGQTSPLPYAADPTVELYPPNLTPDIATGIGSWTDEQLATAIREGQDETGLELCPQMNHFSTMTDYEVNSIVAYLRSLPPVSQKVLRSVCPPLKTKAEQQAGM